jgi:hypothetical protein
MVVGDATQFVIDMYEDEEEAAQDTFGSVH